VFDAPLFVGMGGDPNDISDNWNHSLFAIDKTHWPAFKAWASSITLLDRECGRIVRVGVQLEVLQADPGLLQRRKIFTLDMPTIAITALCVDANDGCWILDPLGNSWEPRHVQRIPVREQTAVYAASMLRSLQK
jgi:hypothetical protein